MENSKSAATLAKTNFHQSHTPGKSTMIFWNDVIVSKPKLRWWCLKTPMSLMIDSTRSGWVRIERWMGGGWMLMKDWSCSVNVVGSWVMRNVWSLNSIIGTNTICVAIWNKYIWFIMIWNFYFLEIHISIYDSYLWLLFVVYIDVLSILQLEKHFYRINTKYLSYF